VNEAMVKMLGYRSKEETARCKPRGVSLFQDPARRAQLLGQSAPQGSVDPIENSVEAEGLATTLRVRFSGQEVFGEQGELHSYEVITEDRHQNSVSSRIICVNRRPATR